MVSEQREAQLINEGFMGTGAVCLIEVHEHISEHGHYEFMTGPFVYKDLEEGIVRGLRSPLIDEREVGEDCSTDTRVEEVSVFVEG